MSRVLERGLLYTGNVVTCALVDKVRLTETIHCIRKNMKIFFCESILKSKCLRREDQRTRNSQTNFPSCTSLNTFKITRLRMFVQIHTFMKLGRDILYILHVARVEIFHKRVNNRGVPIA